MTRLTPEAEAFRAKMQEECSDWPEELVAAATWLRCELDVSRLKGWRDQGGPARLAEYSAKFARLYAEHTGKPPIEDVGKDG